MRFVGKNFIVPGKSILNSNSKNMVAFSFKSANNPLAMDAKGTVLHDSILVQLPVGTGVRDRLPYVLINGVSVSPDNLSPQNFSQPFL